MATHGVTAPGPSRPRDNRSSAPPTVSYHSFSEPITSGPRGGRGWATAACVLAITAMAAAFFGPVFIQDKIVGRVADSHLYAWRYVSPWAAMTGGIGVGICTWVLLRRPNARVGALVALVINALALGIVILSCPKL